MADEVLTARDGAVLTITLNRPDVYNAINRALHEGLAEALHQAADPEIRAVVLTGAGRGFCSARTSVSSSRCRVASVTRSSTRTTRTSARCGPWRSRFWPPSTARSRARASPSRARATCGSARPRRPFVPGFIGIGLVPDAGSTWFLHRVLGFARAFEWMVSSRRLSADEAANWGLLSEVVPADDFPGRVAELAAWYAALPTRGVAMTKRLFEHAYTASLDEQLELEAALQQAATETADFAEGVQAFLDKRPAAFTGR